MSGLFVVAMLCVAFLNIYRNRVQFRNSVTGSRREYLAYLAKTRQNARKAEDMQREFAQWFLPHPGDLPIILEEGTRVGEREPSDEEFLLSRVGAANQPFNLDYTKAEASAEAEADPVSVGHANSGQVASGSGEAGSAEDRRLISCSHWSGPDIA